MRCAAAGAHRCRSWGDVAAEVRICGNVECGAVLDKAFVKKSKKAAAETAEAPKKRTRKRAVKAETAEAPAENN